jgi:predicted amidohydrolase
MKICISQAKPLKGDIENNIENHKRMIQVAVSENADLIVFPELSVTGYEPDLAKNLAIDANDAILNDFQTISDAENISIAVGMPTRSEKGINISLIFFQPHQDRLVYSKKYLHADEEPFFAHGENFPILNLKGKKIAPVICYELFAPEHFAEAHKNNAEIYLASVAKTAGGMERAAHRLSEIARNHAIPVLISNSVGYSDNFLSAGKSAVWDSSGNLLKQLDDENEGLLIFDTEKQETTERGL